MLCTHLLGEGRLSPAVWPEAVKVGTRTQPTNYELIQPQLAPAIVVAVAPPNSTTKKLFLGGDIR